MDAENERLKQMLLKKEHAEWWERLIERHERKLKSDALLQAVLEETKRLNSDNFFEKTRRIELEKDNEVFKERVNSLEENVLSLANENKALKVELAEVWALLKQAHAREEDLDKRNKDLVKRNEDLVKRNEDLVKRNEDLIQRLELHRKSPSGTVTSASRSSSSNAGRISSLDSAAAASSLSKQFPGKSLDEQLRFVVDGKQSGSNSNNGQPKGSDVFDVNGVGLGLEELGAKYTGMSLHDELLKAKEQKLAEEREWEVQQNMQNNVEKEELEELGAVTWSLKGQSIAVLKIDIPGVEENTLNEAVSKDLRKAFADIELDSSVRGVVLISGKPNSFVAGEDIGMLSRCTTAEAAEEVSRNAKVLFASMENSEKTIVAAISGSCMGSGLEMALACDYRIAVNSSKTQFAFPEVTLGLLPSGGGTQRLPKLISLQNALDMMLSGKVIRSDEAKKMGFVDHLIQPLGAELTDPINRMHRFLEKVAISTCEQLAAGTLKPKRKRPVLERVQNLLPTNRVLRVARDKVMKQTHIYPAPLRILDVIRTGLEDGLEEGYKKETKEFGNLTQTTQSQELIGLFKGKTECNENIYGVARKTKRMAVIGAGPMGVAIALVNIEKGIETILVGTSQAELDRALKQITTQMAVQLKRKKFTSADHAVFLTELKLVLENDYAQLRDIDVVVEAEDVVQKRELVQKLENVVPAHCIIAINTSACDIAAGAQDPTRVIGMQYFLPVDKVELLEIIVAEKASKETIAVAVKLGLDLNKKIVVVKSDGNVASVFGLGFPSFWGGPFRFVDLYGAKNLVDQMKRYKEIHPEVQFQPCQLLLDYAKSDEKFYPK